MRINNKSKAFIWSSMYIIMLIFQSLFFMTIIYNSDNILYKIILEINRKTSGICIVLYIVIKIVLFWMSISSIIKVLLEKKNNITLKEDK